jgi:hypothetical protein
MYSLKQSPNFNSGLVFLRSEGKGMWSHSCAVSSAPCPSLTLLLLLPKCRVEVTKIKCIRKFGMEKRATTKKEAFLDHVHTNFLSFCYVELSLIFVPVL